jgi:hypothetical protein
MIKKGYNIKRLDKPLKNTVWKTTYNPPKKTTYFPSYKGKWVLFTPNPPNYLSSNLTG